MRILLRSKLQRFQQYNIGVGAGPTGPVLLFDDLMGFIIGEQGATSRFCNTYRNVLNCTCTQLLIDADCWRQMPFVIRVLAEDHTRERLVYFTS